MTSFKALMFRLTPSLINELIEYDSKFIGTTLSYDDENGPSDKIGQNEQSINDVQVFQPTHLNPVTPLATTEKTDETGGKGSDVFHYPF